MIDAMEQSQAPENQDPRVLALKAGLLVVWAAASFGACFFARDLQFMLGSWPFGYWMAAQGAVLIFIVILVAYSAAMKRLAPGDGQPTPAGPADG